MKIYDFTKEEIISAIIKNPFAADTILYQLQEDKQFKSSEHDKKIKILFDEYCEADDAFFEYDSSLKKTLCPNKDETSIDPNWRSKATEEQKEKIIELDRIARKKWDEYYSFAKQFYKSHFNRF